MPAKKEVLKNKKMQLSILIWKMKSLMLVDVLMMMMLSSIEISIPVGDLKHVSHLS